MRLLEHINFPKDLRQLNPNELPQLAKELREFIILVQALVLWN
jgi:1-deoxy-D-xylulose-5-phosphate synthase